MVCTSEKKKNKGGGLNCQRQKPEHPYHTCRVAGTGFLRFQILCYGFLAER